MYVISALISGNIAGKFNNRLLSILVLKMIIQVVLMIKMYLLDHISIVNERPKFTVIGNVTL